MGKYKTLYCIGENNANWRGGKSEGYNYISSLLRNYCKKRGWLSESIKKQNGKCLFTGLKFECVHHIHSFSSILKETFEENDVVARLGGDEFVAFKLTETSGHEDAIKKRIEEITNIHNLLSIKYFFYLLLFKIISNSKEE